MRCCIGLRARLQIAFGVLMCAISVFVDAQVVVMRTCCRLVSDGCLDFYRKCFPLSHGANSQLILVCMGAILKKCQLMGGSHVAE